ncbi:MAG: enoyl-CoA hydratase-related protein [Alphaproteobacteria bacterium]|nr:enoyl-CoA hydratase-related protein [Alphaproteobacteria bacterium]
MIEVQRVDAVVTLTLSRTDRRNALDQDTWRALAQHFTALAQDDSLGAVILTGAGGHFSAGADIAEFTQARANADAGRAYEGLVDQAHEALARIAAPVLAAVDGVCFGSGFGLALAADLRVAGTSALFAIPATRIGLVYGTRETEALLRVGGLSIAKRLLLTADRLDAAAAHKAGLVDCLTPGSALAEAAAWAGRIVDGAPLAVRGAKAVLTALATGRADPALLRQHRDRCLESADYQEAVAAFLAKRKPQFRGL